MGLNLSCRHSQDNIKTFYINTLLNRGTYGVVHKGDCHRTKDTKKCVKNVLICQDIFYDSVAIKQIFGGSIHYISEVTALYELIKEPHIIHMIGYNEQQYTIVTEYCEGGDLLDWYLDLGRSLTEDEVKIIIKQIIDAIDECHRHNIVHLDIKLENIGLLRKNDIDSIRLLDFNSAKVVDNYDETNDREFKTSPHYTPPELIHKTLVMNKKRIPKANLEYIDYWELGILTYALLTGVYPFDGKTQAIIFCSTLKGTYDWPIDTHISVSCKQFVEKLLVADPVKRLDITHIKHHEWIN
jgi:serine/threonine protein kinase